MKQLEIFPTTDINHSSYAMRQRYADIAEQKQDAKDGLHATVKDLTGERYGFLLIAFMTEERTNGKVVYAAQCDCGQMIKVTSLHLSRIRDCGCRSGRPNSRGWSGETIVRPSLKTAWNGLYQRTRYNAGQRGIRFDIGLNDFITISQKPCHYCGVDPCQTFTLRKLHTCQYNGLDRIDSAGNYELSNVVSCCAICNIAKKEQSVSEFLQWIERVYSHQKGQGNL